jgi:hypothetical protein
MKLGQLAKSRLRWIVGCAALAAIFVAGVSTYFGVRGQKDLVGYAEMSRGFHPVWKDLALRRIKAGDAAAELTVRHPPPVTVEYGNYAEYEFQIASPGYISLSSLRIIAKDGRLILAEAGSCTWDHTFFEIAGARSDQEAAYRRATLAGNLHMTIAGGNRDRAR